MKNEDLPIGVFDSGIGGITVLKELTQCLPEENFIYLGDNARLPYGSKSPQTIRKYTEQNLKFLVTQKVKALVIACNSASAQFSEKVFLDFPVFTVIEPGAKMAMKVTENQNIGILGTRATIASQCYESELKKLGSKALVFAQACPLLVPLAEEGWAEDPLTNLIIYRYVQPLLAHNIDTLILGCTHYPLLKIPIQKAVGQEVKLVDSGLALAEELKNSLLTLNINAKAKSSKSDRQKILIYSTDISPQFEKLAKSLLPLESEIQFLLADLAEVR